MAKQKIEPGMQVRVARASYHYAKFGAVGRVLQQYDTRPDDDCEVLVVCDFGDGPEVQAQFVENQHLKPIKRKG